MHKFILIRSSKFPILPGEKEELVNDGMYGKALAEYLQAKLTDGAAGLRQWSWRRLRFVDTSP
jgi:hypothetical protein